MVNRKSTNPNEPVTDFVIVNAPGSARFSERMSKPVTQSDVLMVPVRIRTRPFIGNGRVEVLLAADKTRVDGYLPKTDQQREKNAMRVQVLPPATLKSFLDPSKRKALESRFGAVGAKCFSRISYLNAFATAIRTRNAGILARAIIGRARQRGQDPVAAFRTKVIDLGMELNDILSDASFVVWWNDLESYYLPGLFCSSIEAALGALAYLEIARGGGVSFCRKPNCHKPFFPSRKKQKYCSPQCQAADGSARYRVRKEKGANL